MELKREQALKPGLYLVPTPIGNLEDITLRALNILSKADLIACEDTRHTGNLLKMLNVTGKKLTSYHDYNEESKSGELIRLISEGQIIALVSDAGTPGLSDPGFRLIRRAAEQQIPIIALPGANALLPALTASGLDLNIFTFFGFPPQKKGRKTFLESVSKNRHTSIMYESSHRILKLIDELITFCGPGRRISISREISKLHEEHIRGRLSAIKTEAQNHPSFKGEFVVVLEGETEG